jgi:dienelactone hydrolase
MAKFLSARLALGTLTLLAIACGAAHAQTPTSPVPVSDRVIAARVVVPTESAVTAAAPTERGIPQYLAQKDAPYVVLTRPIPKSKQTYDLYLIQTRDEILVPMAVRKPAGNGPFPAVLLGSGNGGGSFMRLDSIMYRLEPMIDRMLARGYVVAYGNYRAMVMEGFNDHDGRSHRIYDMMSGGPRVINSEAALDSDDYISMIQQLQALPFVKGDAVGSIGVSHSGELITEAAMFTTWAAAVNSEGANWELSKVDLMRAPHEGRNLMLEEKNLEDVRSLMDKDTTMARIKKIKTPILHMGRPKDELSGMFRVMYDWSKEAGLDSEWVEFDHPRHGYAFLYRRPDGSFQPDPIEEQAFASWMSYLDKRLKGTSPAASK